MTLQQTMQTLRDRVARERLTKAYGRRWYAVSERIEKELTARADWNHHDLLELAAEHDELERLYAQAMQEGVAR